MEERGRGAGGKREDIASCSRANTGIACHGHDIDTGAFGYRSSGSITAASRLTERKSRSRGWKGVRKSGEDEREGNGGKYVGEDEWANTTIYRRRWGERRREREEERDKGTTKGNRRRTKEGSRKKEGAGATRRRGGERENDIRI